MTRTLMDHRPVVILDSNAVFDWLLFDDPSCRPLAGAIERGEVAWVATSDMIEEADTVIARGTFAARLETCRMLQLRRAALLHVVAAPAAALTTPRCTDPDDQKFIDLAMAWPGCWLVTRDRALLKLRRRALQHGVRVIQPREWARA